MSIVDEIKSLFHTKADEYSQRLGRIENHLGNIEKSNGRTADQLDFELLNQMFVIPAATPKGVTNLEKAAQLLEVPKGSWFELIGWTAVHNNESDKPVLTRNNALWDTPNAYNVNMRFHKSTTQGLVLNPGDVLGALNIEKEQETIILIQFKVYTEQPTSVARSGEGG